MSTEVLLSIVKALAPTVADKLLNAIGERKMKQQDLYIAILSINAEINAGNSALLREIDQRLKITESGMISACESLAVLLERTKVVR